MCVLDVLLIEHLNVPHLNVRLTYVVCTCTVLHLFTAIRQSPRDREESPGNCRPAHRQPVPTLTQVILDNKDY
jgi:hypothetical protein